MGLKRNGLSDDKEVSERPTRKTTTMNAKDSAAAIRKTLKTSYGISSRQVSVRSDSFSMGSAVDVTIKDPSIEIDLVEAIVDQFSRIRRCEVTGEILSGGNLYTSTGYSDEARTAIGAPYVAQLQAAIDDLPDGVTHRNVTERVTVAEAGNGFGFQLWDDTSPSMHVSDAKSGAFYVGLYEMRAASMPTQGHPDHALACECKLCELFVSVAA